MSTQRRDFLRQLAIGGSVLATGLPTIAHATSDQEIDFFCIEP